jgi:methionine synthase II (cobalamin-independent)
MDWDGSGEQSDDLDSEFDLGSPALDIQAMQPLIRAKTVTLGAVRIHRCSSHSAEQIEAQLEEALQQFGSPLRTLPDEDCGLTDHTVWEDKMHRLRMELDRISRKHRD